VPSAPLRPWTKPPGIGWRAPLSPACQGPRRATALTGCARPSPATRA
jgi:hypothetical protein